MWSGTTRRTGLPAFLHTSPRTSVEVPICAFISLAGGGGEGGDSKAIRRDFEAGGGAWLAAGGATAKTSPLQPRRRPVSQSMHLRAIAMVGSGSERGQKRMIYALMWDEKVDVGRFPRAEKEDVTARWEVAVRVAWIEGDDGVDFCQTVVFPRAVHHVPPPYSSSCSQLSYWGTYYMTKSTDVFHPLLCSTWLAMARAPEGETLASLFLSTRKMATTQSDTEFAYTAITYIGCRGLVGLSKTTFNVFKSQCPVRAIVFIEGFEDAGYPIDSLRKAIAKRDTEATSKPSTNWLDSFANLVKKKKAKSMETPPMIFFSKPTTNVEIRLYVTDRDEEKLLAQTKVPLGSLDGDVKVSRTSLESLPSLKEDPVMTFKRTTHSEFDCKLTSIGDLPPINSIFLATFANVKRFIGVGKALSEHRDTLLPLAAATLSRERQSASEPCGQWSALQSGEERSALKSILPLLGSLLSGSTFDANEVPVLPLHTSFRDFLVEPVKAPGEGEVKVPKGPDFSVDIGPRHQELLALACLDITNAQLRFNMCGFDTSYALNSEIEGIQKRAEKLDPELKYACRCAAYHLDKSLGALDEQVTPTDPQKSRAEGLNRLRAALSFFLKNRFLYWLEIHSCMESWQDGPGGMLPCFQKWASVHSPGELVSILADFINFEKRFRHGYMLSAPQLYYSGLTFSPEASKVRQLYEAEFCIPITVINGREKIWPTTETLVIRAEDCVTSVAFSPDGAQIVSGSSDKTIRIWDAGTGQQVGDALTGHEDWVRSVAFSPDGTKIVSGSSDRTIRIWDAATRWQLQGAAAFSATVFSNTAKGHGNYMRTNDALYKPRCPPPRPFVRRGEWLCYASNPGFPDAHILWIPPVFGDCIMMLYPCLMAISTQKLIFLKIQDIAIGPRWKDIHKSQDISS
ncbi:hypothetical protein BDN71DRAFT_1498685 [Pleurotus eryngii]|uniref:Uncharacterized protein n=1 Tax=Pleurotus eryngii TaxID=5323 RepID=A0A9P6DB03_PLEER|nr:hypothetical protein BDN71DRAFT_1498685 [Pleurotus eryngii]